MDLIKYQKFRDDVIMCEFECYFAHETCEKIFALEKFQIEECELTFLKPNDELDACDVRTYDEVRKYKDSAVTCRYDGVYNGERTAALVDFNAKFLAVRSTKENNCYDLASKVITE